MFRPMICLLWICVCTAGIGNSVIADEPPKPNIIYIMADDLGYGDLGCYGREDVRTPRIDALAEQGLKFTDYHSNGAVCSPTRAAFITGRYQQRCGIEGVVTAAGHRDTGLSPQELSIAKLLQAAGYRTALFGKWHLGYETRYNPIHHGFDEFRGFVSGNVDYQSHIDQTGRADWWHGDQPASAEGYVTELITEYGVEFIQRHKDKRFFLFLSHAAPHYPIQGPDDPPLRTPGGPREPVGRRADHLEGYRRMIAALDDSVGEIVDAVREAGLAERTLIVFVSDNGAAQRFGGDSGGLKGWKGSLAEGGHRVPCIAFLPGRIEPGTTGETVAGFDWSATFLAMAGAPIPADRPLDGIDLSALLFRSEPLPARELFWSRGPGNTAIRRGDWKLIHQNARIELYNLADDPGEANNLAGEQPALVEELLQRLKSWDRQVREDVHRRS